MTPAKNKWYILNFHGIHPGMFLCDVPGPLFLFLVERNYGLHTRENFLHRLGYSKEINKQFSTSLLFKSEILHEIEAPYSI